MRCSISALRSAPDKDSGPALRFEHRAIVSDLSAILKLSFRSLVVTQVESNSIGQLGGFYAD
jgi:hypothetical protein